MLLPQLAVLNHTRAHRNLALPSQRPIGDKRRARRCGRMPNKTSAAQKPPHRHKAIALALAREARAVPAARHWTQAHERRGKAPEFEAAREQARI